MSLTMLLAVERRRRRADRSDRGEVQHDPDSSAWRGCADPLHRHAVADEQMVAGGQRVGERAAPGRVFAGEVAVVGDDERLVDASSSR